MFDKHRGHIFLFDRCYAEPMLKNENSRKVLNLSFVKEFQIYFQTEEQIVQKCNDVFPVHLKMSRGSET